MIRIFRRPKPKIAVCTSICGNYDPVKEATKQSIDCDFIHFTDEEKTAKEALERGWTQAIVRRFCYSTTRMDAKFPKLLTHVCLPQYDIVVWVDGQVQIDTADYVEMMVSCIGDKEFAFIPHWKRDCIYDEIVAMHKNLGPKYKGSITEQQVESYRKEGMPGRFGLWAGTSFARKNNTLKSHQIGSLWFNEDIRWNTEKKSSNDQLALAYTVWKYNLKKYLGKIPYEEWEKRMTLKPHNSPD